MIGRCLGYLQAASKVVQSEYETFIHSFIHLLYMKPTEYKITMLKIKTPYQLSDHWQLQGR